MPFRDGVFYAYPPGESSQHSSAGGTTPPSLLLHSPLSQSSSKGYSSIPPASMTPSSSGSGGGGATAIPVPAATTRPFRFQSRREAVDWRRMGAVCVERVVSEVDVDALQEHVNAVTFCSVDAERCQRCQSPVDPALIKLFRLAQLTVEWLLHCQGFLARSLQATEERLEAADRGREQLALREKAWEESARAAQKKQREKAKTATKKQEEKIRELMAELDQREKIIRTQQSMFAPGVISNRKCPHCDKTFINAGFLQNHMQRRHPDEYDSQLQSDNDTRSQMESLRKENNSLKEQLIQQQQSLLLNAAQEKEHQSKYNDLQKELEHLKALETARRREDNRDGIHIRREEVDREVQTHAILKLEQQLKEQDRKWESRMKEIKTQHESEKDQDRKWESRMQEIEVQHESEKSQWWDEMSRMQSLMSEQQKRSNRMKELERRLKEKESTISAQREQMKKISTNPPPAKPAKALPVILTAPAPEPKAKRVVLDSSSISEKPAAKKRPEPRSERRRGVTASALRRNPNIKKELRPALEQALNDKLDELGVTLGQRGLRGKEFSSILSRLRSERENIAKTKTDYWHHREEVMKTLEQRMRQGTTDSGGKDSQLEQRMRQGTTDSHPTIISTEPRAKDKYSAQASQSRPQASGPPSRHVTQVVSGPPPPPLQQVRTPQPAPRTKTTGPPKTSSTPHSYRTTTPKTSPFSSEDESEEDQMDDEDEEEEEAPQKRRHEEPWGKAHQTRPLRARGAKAGPGVPSSRPGVSASRQQTHAKQLSSSSSLQQATPPTARAPAAGVVTQTAVTTLESAEEWSDVSELQEIDPTQLHGYQHHHDNTDSKRGAAKGQSVSELARVVERQAADRGQKRPVGGVSVLPGRKDVVQELMYTDLEDCSDWLTSSLEDEGSKPLKKTLESSSTSVWGTSTGNKGQRSGLTEAGTTGSTLKSSLVSLSDLSDSEDI